MIKAYPFMHNSSNFKYSFYWNKWWFSSMYMTWGLLDHKLMEQKSLWALPN